MRFDWYAASADKHVDEVLPVLVNDAFPDSSFRPAKPLNAYDFGGEVHLGETVVARLMWGGKATGGGVHVVSTSDNAPALAVALRRRVPEHRVTRADVCIDYEDASAFSALSGILFDLSDRCGVQTSMVGDWKDAVRGRTLYVGSPRSTFMVRLYEKGIKEGGSPDWVRLEAQVQPKQRSAKEAAAKAAPAEFFGYSGWGRVLAGRLEMPDVPRVAAGTLFKPSDHERALRFLFKQYGKTLQVEADKRPNPVELGEWLQAMLKAARSS